MRIRTQGLMAAIALALGFLSTQQIRTVDTLKATATAQEGRTLDYLVTRTLEQNAALTVRIKALQKKVAAVAVPTLSSRRRRQIQALALAAGLAPARGPGVEVVVHDASGPLYPGEPAQLELVHDQYILHIVSLLVGQGAEAVSINGQRFVSTTAIFCAGPTIRVNGIPYGSPFVVRAVGPVAPMLKALTGDPDVQGWAQLVSIRYRARSHLEIPAYSLPVHLPLDKPVKIGG